MPSGIFTDATTTLASALTALGLVPVTDARNARPLTVFVEPPSFDAFNAGRANSVADITFTIRILAAPPGNQDATDYLLTIMDQIFNSDIVVTSGRPSLTVVGSQEIPSYDLTVRMSARSS
jgi:hypothetical protein